MLRGSPQSDGIDTLYYLHDTTHFIPEYAIAEEIFHIHTKFYPKPNWQSYRILELHLLFRPSKIGDTIQSISFYKDTLQQLVFTHTINEVLDSNDVYPNWFKVIIDNQTPISDYIEVPAWWGDLCEVQPVQISGNTIGFYETSQAWGVFHDLPIKLIIQQIPVEVRDNDPTVHGFYLEQNYPNPFNPSTKISFTIPNVGTGLALTVLKVYDVLGNEVATLVDEYKPAGRYEVEFNPASSIRVNNIQQPVSSIKYPASGVYFYQLRVRQYNQTMKMLFFR